MHGQQSRYPRGWGRHRAPVADRGPCSSLSSSETPIRRLPARGLLGWCLTAATEAAVGIARDLLPAPGRSITAAVKPSRVRPQAGRDVRGGGRRAAAHHQVGREVDPSGRGLLAPAEVEDQPGRGLGHLDERLAHRGERRPDPPGEGQIVEADDAEVLRDAQAQLASGLVDAERLQVVAGEDGGGRLGQPQEFQPAV